MTITDIGVKAATDLLNNLTQAKAFALEQAPDVLQQMVALEIHQCIFVMIGAGIVCIALWFIVYKIDDAEAQLFVSGVSLLPFIGILCKGYDLMSVMTAPKVFLIHALSKMVR